MEEDVKFFLTSPGDPTPIVTMAREGNRDTHFSPRHATFPAWRLRLSFIPHLMAY